MRGGGLRHRVTIQRATDSDNAYGEPVQAWSDLMTVWALVDPIAGKEKFASMYVDGEVGVRVLVRYNSTIAGLAINDRLLFNGAVYDIKAVINAEYKNTHLEIFCKLHT